MKAVTAKFVFEKHAKKGQKTDTKKIDEMRLQAVLRGFRKIIYPVRYLSILLYAGDKQDFTMPFKPFENGLSNGVNGTMGKKR